MIKYLGSKKRLLPSIINIVQSLGQQVRSVADPFSGTARVGHALKALGYRVLANDHNRYAVTLARCYVQADREKWENKALSLIEELQRLPGRPGYFTETFCRQARYVQPQNGERVDAIRDRIRELALEPELEAIVLVSLLEATDRVDSTTGLQMAYLKKWSARSFNELTLRVPKLLRRAVYGAGLASEADVLDFVQRHEVDVLYLDPPYNQHSYLGNYHVWETLVRWDAPETYGTAQKRIDCRERRSLFNYKRQHRAAFERVLGASRSPYVLISFNDEGFLPRDELESMLSVLGSVRVFEHDYKRYVGAQIGIHNPAGERVGEVSHLRNTEYLFLLCRDGTPNRLH